MQENTQDKVIEVSQDKIENMQQVDYIFTQLDATRDAIIVGIIDELQDTHPEGVEYRLIHMTLERKLGFASNRYMRTGFIEDIDQKRDKLQQSITYNLLDRMFKDTNLGEISTTDEKKKRVKLNDLYRDDLSLYARKVIFFAYEYFPIEIIAEQQKRSSGEFEEPGFTLKVKILEEILKHSDEVGNVRIGETIRTTTLANSLNLEVATIVSILKYLKKENFIEYTNTQKNPDKLYVLSGNPNFFPEDGRSLIQRDRYYEMTFAKLYRGVKTVLSDPYACGRISGININNLVDEIRTLYPDDFVTEPIETTRKKVPIILSGLEKFELEKGQKILKEYTPSPINLKSTQVALGLRRFFKLRDEIVDKKLYGEEMEFYADSSHNASILRALWEKKPSMNNVFDEISEVDLRRTEYDFLLAPIRLLLKQGGLVVIEKQKDVKSIKQILAKGSSEKEDEEIDKLIRDYEVTKSVQVVDKVGEYAGDRVYFISNAKRFPISFYINSGEVLSKGANRKQIRELFEFLNEYLTNQRKLLHLNEDDVLTNSVFDIVSEIEDERAINEEKLKAIGFSASQSRALARLQASYGKHDEPFISSADDTDFAVSARYNAFEFREIDKDIRLYKNDEITIDDMILKHEPIVKYFIMTLKPTLRILDYTDTDDILNVALFAFRSIENVLYFDSNKRSYNCITNTKVFCKK